MTHSMLWVMVPLCLLVAALRLVDAAEPDAADKIAARLTTVEFGPIGQPLINRAWPIRYGRADVDQKRKEGWNLAAGQALYASQCARCHGDDGSGEGPEAKKSTPSPRDFRRGIFKFHEDAVGHWVGKPSRHDLAETIRLGLPSTSMPAFDKLTDEQRNAVVEYVRWLAMRGQFAYDIAKQLRGDFDTPADASREELDDYVAAVAETLPADWRREDREETSPPVSDPPPMTAASVARGEALFQGNRFACYKCHGKDGRGKTLGDPFIDAWGKTQAMPDLTAGTFKGGDGPHDLYWRIRDGISGSPHPHYQGFDRHAKSDEPFWDVVHYVYHLAGLKPEAAKHARRRPSPEVFDEDEFAEETAPTDSDDDDDVTILVAQGWGKISGRIIYGGREVPPRAKLPIVGDAAKFLQEKTILSPALIVNEKNFGVANVVVWIDLRQADGLLPIHASQREPPAKEVVIASRDFQFQPHVVIARVGQPILLRNENPAAENFRLEAKRNPAFNQVSPAGKELNYELRQEERLPLSLTSALHPWAKSYVVATAHPYVAVTDEEGAFAFDQVPAGTWQVRLWHEQIGSVSRGSIERGAFSLRDGKRFLTAIADEDSQGEIVLDEKLFGH